MKNPILSLLIQVVMTIIAVFILLFTLNQLDNQKKEVQRLHKKNQELQNELNLCAVKKVATTGRVTAVKENGFNGGYGDMVGPSLDTIFNQIQYRYDVLLGKRNGSVRVSPGLVLHRYGRAYIYEAVDDKLYGN